MTSAASGQTADPIIKTSHPHGSVRSANYPLSISLVFGQTGWSEDSLKLSLDGTDVTAAARFKSSAYTWQLELPLSLVRESRHSYEVRVQSPGRANFVFSATFSTDVRGAGDLLIEAEDFNYSGGAFKPAAALPNYPGGAYEGMGAAHAVDYFQATASNTITDNYRVGEERNLTILYSDQLERSGYDLTRSWIVVGGREDWFNYTRPFTRGHFWVYAAVSAPPDAGRLQGSLSRVTNPHSTEQTSQELGLFEGNAGEGWGENRLLPLIDPSTKSRVPVLMDGTETIRYSVVQGALDYLVFVPFFPLTLTTLSRNRIQLDWTGSGLLEEASDPAGPWEAKGGYLSPPVEIILPEQSSRGFYRLRPPAQSVSLPSAAPHGPSPEIRPQ